MQEYSKCWVEINHAAAAYDELNMCKSRLIAFDPEAEDDDDNDDVRRSKFSVSVHEIDYTIAVNRQELQDAEQKFFRSQGTLKYLKHLERTAAEPIVCPICKQTPDHKYSVLECGHHLCMICLAQMRQFCNVHLDCCVCRHKQQFEK